MSLPFVSLCEAVSRMAVDLQYCPSNLESTETVGVNHCSCLSIPADKLYS